jgi:hypothetical protein
VNDDESGDVNDANDDENGDERTKKRKTKEWKYGQT